MLRLTCHSARFALALAFLASAAFPAFACPFCAMQGKSLIGEVKETPLVVIGTVKNIKADPKGDGIEGTADLVVEKVIKSDQKENLVGKALKVKSTFGMAKNTKFLVFCDIYMGKIDAYRGIKVEGNLGEYLDGALKLDKAETVDRLKFYYKYLFDNDIEIAIDAYKEFSGADVKDVRALVGKLTAADLAKAVEFLEKPTASYKSGLFASFLGYSGKKEYAEKLRKVLDDPDRRAGGGVDGIIASYVMLDPEEGWKLVRSVMADGTTEFPYRNAALRAVRFFYDAKDSRITRDAAVSAVLLLLPQYDMADLAIEELRRWERWECVGRVLELRDQWVWESFRVAIKKTESNKAPFDGSNVRRAVLRYALECKTSDAAKAYVEAERKRNPSVVADCEYLLKVDKASANR